ncbi:MAG: [Fe-Fe] hydrogenase large subunit C-terminal domain-containing protein [Bacteroidota bacterium]
MNLVEINTKECKLSYSCIRVCPVKAIEVRAEAEFPYILPERCIGCGLCVTACGQNAIYYSSSREVVKELLDSRATIAAMLSPEIAAEFGDVSDYRKFVNMIKKLGFAYVTEVSFGVDLVARKYAELFTQFKGKYYITANCPAVVSFVEKFHPELTGNLAPIVSPMEAMAKVVHQKYGQDLKIVYIGPCIDSKAEAIPTQGDGKVDAVLTFQELRELFTEFHISENTLEYSEFDPPFGFKGALYPFSEGILQAADISRDLLSGFAFTAEGRDNVLESLQAFETQLDSLRHHFNLFLCEGCLNGPGMTRGSGKFLKRARVVDYANKRMSDIDRHQWEKEIIEFQNLDLSRVFKRDDQRIPYPSEEKVNEILKILGKTEQDEELGCGTCGYKSCREFAISVAQGLARTEMCHSYSLRNRQEYIKTLKQTNEKLAKTQEALKDSERKARKDQMIALEAMETSQAMLRKLPTGLLVVDDKLRIQQSNDSFVNILGKDAAEINEIIPGLKGADLKTLVPYPFYNLFSYVLEKDEDVMNRDVHFGDHMLNLSVFSIRKNKLAGAVVRDMFMPEVAKEEVIRRVGAAIDENLELVQKIAFLLGEGASRTEHILNSIIDFSRTDKK